MPSFETFDVFEHVSRVRLRGRLAQPGQPSRLAVVALEQVVEAVPVDVRQRIVQGHVDAPVGAGDGLCADAHNSVDSVDSVDSEQDDRMPPQVLDQHLGQHDTLINLQGQIGQHLHHLPVVAHGEGLEAEHRLQLDQVRGASVPAGRNRSSSRPAP